MNLSTAACDDVVVRFEHAIAGVAALCVLSSANPARATPALAPGQHYGFSGPSFGIGAALGGDRVGLWTEAGFNQWGFWGPGLWSVNAGAVIEPPIDERARSTTVYADVSAFFLSAGALVRINDAGVHGGGFVGLNLAMASGKRRKGGSTAAAYPLLQVRREFIVGQPDVWRIGFMLKIAVGAFYEVVPEYPPAPAPRPG